MLDDIRLVDSGFDSLNWFPLAADLTSHLTSLSGVVAMLLAIGLVGAGFKSQCQLQL